MALKTMIFLMLATLFTVNKAASTGEEYGQVYEETDVVLKDGTLLREEKMIDANCRFENNTATFPDESMSTVLNDYAENKGLMLFSNVTDVCYVRDIPKQEEKLLTTCNKGTVQRKKSDPVEERTEFVEGEELNLDDLPEALRAQCDGRKVVKMVERSIREHQLAANRTELVSGDDVTSLPRVKRSWCWSVVCWRTWHCVRFCSWWFRCWDHCVWYDSCRVDYGICWPIWPIWPFGPGKK